MFVNHHHHLWSRTRRNRDGKAKALRGGSAQPPEVKKKKIWSMMGWGRSEYEKKN